MSVSLEVLSHKYEKRFSLTILHILLPKPSKLSIPNKGSVHKFLLKPLQLEGIQVWKFAKKNNQMY